MHKCLFGIHNVKFMVELRKMLCDCCRVLYHAAGSQDFSHFSIWNNHWQFISQPHPESCWTPINKLYGLFCPKTCNSQVDISWYYISTVHQRTCNVLSFVGVTLNHQILLLKSTIRDDRMRLKIGPTTFLTIYYRRQ